MNWLKCLLLLGSVIYQVSSSAGDSSLVYRFCTDNCRKVYSCPESFDSCAWSSGSCFRCRYNCMWTTVSAFVEQHGFVPQFHGKWPFLAMDFSVIGMTGLVIQEPASFIFSLLNFCSFCSLYRIIKLLHNLKNNRVWILYTSTGLVTWLCSALFHARDCWFTEYLDYFSAFAFILCASYVSFCFTQSSVGMSARSTLWISSFYGSLLFLWFARHVYHMMRHGIEERSDMPPLPLCLKIIPITEGEKTDYFGIHLAGTRMRSIQQHFDYGYNMRCCIGVSLFTTAIYLLYIGFRWRRFHQLSKSDRMLIGIIAWTNGSVLLETLDFAPLFWILDAHSLFHAATVPLPIYLSIFLRQHLLETEYSHSKNV